MRTYRLIDLFFKAPDSRHGRSSLIGNEIFSLFYLLRHFYVELAIIYTIFFFNYSVWHPRVISAVAQHFALLGQSAAAQREYKSRAQIKRARICSCATLSQVLSRSRDLRSKVCGPRPCLGHSSGTFCQLRKN